MIWKIAITGPESTGKSELARQLASHYNTVWVPEYAREYIDLSDRQYVESDLLIIARKQLELENSILPQANNYLFCDSDFLVLKIWGEFKYGRCHPWIAEQFTDHLYDLYLLCDIDLPWVEDPQREHPHKRKELFSLYEKALLELNFPYRIISGQGKERLLNAIKFINETFHNHH